MRWTLPGLMLLLGGLSSPLAAQIDYRNLDDDRPLHTEDAYPVERHAFELLLPYAFETEAGGARQHALVPEIEYGILRNAQIGFKVPLAGETGSGRDRWGVAGLSVFGLYNFNSETHSLPGLAARADLLLPVGSLGGDATRVRLKAIATRSWGLTRAHLNASWTFGPEDSLSAFEPGNRWEYSLAADRTFFRQSLLLAGEVAVARSIRGAPVAVDAGLGIRYQWTPTLVLDLGVRRRLRSTVGPDLGLTLGVSHAFGLPWLMPVAR